MTYDKISTKINIFYSQNIMDLMKYKGYHDRRKNIELEDYTTNQVL